MQDLEATGGGRDSDWQRGCGLAVMAAVGMWLGSVDEGSLARGPGSLVAFVSVERGSPVAPPSRMPACPLVRGRQGCSLAAMGAVGTRLDSADEGSLPEGRGRSSPCLPVERGSPVAPPACPLVRGRQGCSLAAMAAVGIELGSADEGSPARGAGRRLVACLPAEQDRRWPRPHARWPAREGGAAGMRIGGDGGGRDSAWQRG
jgi:hypothetical protein